MSLRYDEARKLWCVDVPPSLGDGKRIRRYFHDETSAEVWMAQRTIERSRGDEIQLNASAEERGHSVRSVVALYLGAKGTEVCAGQRKLSANHHAKLNTAFSSSPIDTVDAMKARDWLRSLDCAQRTRYGVFSTCRTFYRWAIRYGYAEKNPFDRMEVIPKGEASKATLSPAQMRKLLSSKIPEHMRAWLVLGGFCGLRTEEIIRMDWSAVNLGAKEIHVSPEVIKKTRGMRERYAEIPENAVKILRVCRGTGPILPIGRLPSSSGQRRWRASWVKSGGRTTACATRRLPTGWLLYRTPERLRTGSAILLRRWCIPTTRGPLPRRLRSSGGGSRLRRRGQHLAPSLPLQRTFSGLNKLPLLVKMTFLPSLGMKMELSRIISRKVTQPMARLGKYSIKIE